MEYQILDIRHVLAAIGRRLGVVVTFFLLGVVVGVVLLFVSPPTYQARARVLLPPSAVDAQGNELRDPKTEAIIITSPEILTPVGQSLSPPISAQALAKRVSVKSISNQIEEVAVDAPSAGEAARLANAIARAYIASNNNAASGAANLSTSVLSTELNSLNQQILTLDAQIARDNATLTGLAPAAEQQEASVIDSLRSQEASLVEQQVTIQSNIANAQLSIQLSRQGTQLLQPATAPSTPIRPRPLLILSVGPLLGLIIGAIAAFAVEQGDRRLRLRDEIAMVAGAPVLASLVVPRSAGVEDGRAQLARWQPTVVDNLALRQAFDRLDLLGGTPANLLVVTLAGDTAAPVLSLLLACFASERPTPTAFIFGTRHESNASLRATCRAIAAAGAPLREHLVVYGAGADQPVDLDAAELSVTLIVADPGPIILPTWDRRTVTVIALSSGLVTGERLQAVVAACIEAGLPVAGVFLANPDTSDPTTGRGDPSLALGPGRRGVAWAAVAASGRPRLDLASATSGSPASVDPPRNGSSQTNRRRRRTPKTRRGPGQD